MVGNPTKVQAVYDKIAHQHAQYREAKKAAVRRAAKATWKHMSADTAFIVSVVAFVIAIVYTVVTIFTH
ncbi:hypothetical protein FHT21_000735 [Pedobacter sp. SG908]|nr:hypothetical protein [Pedobacter sp. SG908]NMN35694.1 hypothetical protein [Pedobacter sp. SG918]